MAKKNDSAENTEPVELNDQDNVTDNDSAENTEPVVESSDPVVFWVEGFGNISGVKTQIQAEKEAKSIIEERAK